MKTRLTELQKAQVLEMLDRGLPTKEIAGFVGISVVQVSAVMAHRKMGTYGAQVHQSREVLQQPNGVFLGYTTDSRREFFWDPKHAVNPHMLILGESGFGKTYSMSCLLAELQRANIASLVFDYGQGFSRDSAPEGFSDFVCPTEIEAARRGVQINPFEIFPFDLHGPTTVAQRVAGTLARIYRNLGIQQHAIIREAILDVFKEAGIFAKLPSSWNRGLPTFDDVRSKLIEFSDDPSRVDRKIAKAAASHISSLFIFDLFRDDGEPVRWNDLIAPGRVTVFQLRGIDQDLQRVVTEFLLWNLLASFESAGPAPLRCFGILDEAHRLLSGAGTAVDRLLREGRKFGIGTMLASQQPEDFDEVAFSNTATKLVFQISDSKGVVAKRLQRKLRSLTHHRVSVEAITTLSRGIALAIQENEAALVKIASLDERISRWQQRQSPTSIVTQEN
jgi:DNA phosphorothioation-dependent restriction protein DptH